MKKIIVNQGDFKNIVNEIYKEEQVKVLNEMWSNLKKSDKIFVLEFLKVLHPEKSKILSEARWYNTIGDIAGIFDPTGAIDLMNGISYWKQGDKLFAILSWVSVIPLLGDVLAKPVIGLFKIGGKGIRLFKEAALAGDAVRIAETAGKSGGVVSKFVAESPSWGSKLITMLRNGAQKFPVIKRFLGLIEEYVKVFVNAGKRMKTGPGIIGKLLGRGEKKTLIDTFRGFRDYGGFKNSYFKYISSKDVGLWKKFTAGVPHLLGGNPATRSLMRRSKWYLGLLDTLGIVDSKTTPDEILAKYPEKIKEYNNTETAQKNWSEDFGGGETEETPTPTVNKTEKGSTESGSNVNPFDVFAKSIFA